MSKHIESSKVIACPVPTSKRFQDLKGKRFGRLLVGSWYGKRISKWTGNNYWTCLCNCGQTVVVRAADIKSGKTRSCGCLQREITAQRVTTHGLCGTREYQIWTSMLQRCMNAKLRTYNRWGGRGITVCERWKDFVIFLADMGKRPAGARSIERVKNNGNYEPGNCVWGTPKEQARNTRRNRLITFGGKTMCLAAWEEAIGLPSHILASRLYRGWSEHRALTQPPRHKTAL